MNHEDTVNHPDIVFQPWIGKNYANGNNLFNTRILIVGESNFTDDIERERPHDTFTHRLIEARINGCKKHQFFKNIERIFVENTIDKNSREQFWDSIAYCEYIQDWLPRPRVCPDEEMWRKAAPVFNEVVAKLKPQCILFVCKRLYRQVEPNFPDSTALEITHPDALRIYRSSHPTKRIDQAKASWIYHPTGAFKFGGFRKARGVVSALIQAAGGKARV